MKSLALAAACLALAQAVVADDAPPTNALPDPGNATWHIGLANMFGTKEATLTRDYNLNFYTVFADGKFSHALGSARAFNTSLHFVEKAEVVLSGTNVTGKFSALITPDQWVPHNHQPVKLDVEIDGFLHPSVDKKGKPILLLAGAFKAVMHGSNAGPGPDVNYEGKLIGGVGPSEPGWDNATFSAFLTPVPAVGDPTEAGLKIELGVAGGNVNWGTIGTAWTKNGEVGRNVPFDTSTMKVGPLGASGKVVMPNRALDITCDPSEQAEVELTFVRVQGMVGGRADVTVKRDGKAIRTYQAFGRGGGNKGAGGPRTAASPQWMWDDKLNMDPWWTPVKDFKPVEPGEHPRLLFRKADVPALRKRAETAEGKAILERLRLLLDGKNGDSLPTVFNQTPPDNHDQTPNMPAGSFTTWHGAGYGLLYQVTGDKKYAELARQAVQLCFDGKIDIDNRYAWFMPGTDMRAGSLLTGIALAYDLCYDAWPEDFRKKVATEIQDYDKPLAPSDGKPGTSRVNLYKLATAGGYPPGSNHYGAYLGVGFAILAILNDPGTDTAKLTKLLGYVERHAVHMIYHGFGDGGFYPEGHHPARLSANGGFLEFVMALRTAAGRDYANAQPNVSWITLRWLLETGTDLSFMHRGVYGGDMLESGGVSHDGEIPVGFGTIPDKFKPAWLWFYDNVYGPRHKNWGAAHYPHRAVYSYVFWPIGTKPVHPGEVVPKAYADTIHGYFYNRKGWKDANDIIVTHAMDLGPKGYYGLEGSGKNEKGCWVKGLGFMRVRFPAPEAKVTAYVTAPDGSSVVSSWTGGPTPASFAVDFSGASGAEALLVSVGPNLRGSLPKAETKTTGSLTPTQVKTGDLTYNLLALHTGEAPKPEVDGNTVKVGKQTITFDGKRIVLGVWNAR
jgi:hypothetical protein